MCTDATNGGFEGCEVQNDIGCPLEGEATTSESRLHLNDILDMLVRLDQQGIFMDPVHDAFAPDYLKVIKKPMCFLSMREKIFADEYTSWSSFVEDFEYICDNAMKYNQKHTKIWNAAKSLLSHGKRCLEQQLMKHQILIDICKKADGYEVSKVKGEMMHESILPSQKKQAKAPLIEELDCCASKNLDLKTAAQKLTVESMAVQGQIENSPHDQQPAVKKLCDDVTLDILELSSKEEVRTDIRGETTDCSSSFSGLQDEVDDEIHEAESTFWDGNGAHVLTEEQDTPKRKRKPLNCDWKSYRQGIGWRCRWLELRIKELEAQAVKYGRILDNAKSLTEQCLEQQHGPPAARTRMSNRYKQKIHVLKRRQRRRRVEEISDIMRLYMLKHPVFSRYGKKKQRSEEEPLIQEYCDDKQGLLQFTEFHLDSDDHYEASIPVENDSLEDLLWQIETLQVQVVDLQAQLNHGRSSYPCASKALFIDSSGPPPLMSMLGTSAQVNAMEAHSRGGHIARTLVHGSKVHGSSSSRRRNSDFDISNVIMPDTVVATYVEPPRHAFIETPCWRFVKESSPADAGGSSHEDTDDEAYRLRHTEMQTKERQQHNTPLLLHKTRNVSSAKERPRQITAIDKGPVVDALAGEEDEHSLTAARFGNIPRRKRTKINLHQRRGALSIGDETKATHTNANIN